MNGFNYERFIRVWQASNSISDVMFKLSITRMEAYYRARIMRRNNVKLKDMRRSAPAQDWKALATLAEKEKNDD